MTTARSVALALLLSTLACGDDDRREVPTIDVVDRREAQARARTDPHVIAPLLVPREPERVVYTPPPDLSEVARADTIVGLGVGVRNRIETGLPQAGADGEPGAEARGVVGGPTGRVRRGAGRDTTAGQPQDSARVPDRR